MSPRNTLYYSELKETHFPISRPCVLYVLNSGLIMVKCEVQLSDNCLFVFTKEKNGMCRTSRGGWLKHLSSDDTGLLPHAMLTSPTHPPAWVRGRGVVGWQ